MTPEAWLQLVLQGGAVAVLLIVGWLLLRGDLITKGSHAAELEAIRSGNAALITEVTRDRDEWKGIAKTAVGEVGELGEALTVRNRIDEGILKSGVLSPGKT